MKKESPIKGLGTKLALKKQTPTFEPIKVKPHEVEVKFPNGDRIKLTQYLTQHNSGHYFYYIQNKNLNIVSANSSTCAPKDKMTRVDVIKIYQWWKRDAHYFLDSLKEDSL